MIRNPSWTAAAALLLAAAVAPAWQAQKQSNGPRPYPHPPDIAGARYGPHERNVLDVWKAKADRPAPVVVFIHGGGFTAGDKSQVPPALLDQCLRAGIAVASINYRYSTIAPYPAPMEDGARAVQYIRLHAGEWNINPKAVACSGGSAGAGISLWIGFHDDLAQPAATDPVQRQSTRISAMGVLNAQISYDPRFVAKLTNEDTGRHPALAKLFGVPEGQDVMTAKQAFPLYEAGAPLTHLNAGDPPAFFYYSRELREPPPSIGEGIHSPRFGLYIKEKMDRLGIECTVKTMKDYNAGQMPPRMFQDMIAFFQKYFAK